MSIQHLHNDVLEDGGEIHQFLGFWICGVVDFVLLIFLACFASLILFM